MEITTLLSVTEVSGKANKEESDWSLCFIALISFFMVLDEEHDTDSWKIRGPIKSLHFYLFLGKLLNLV